MVSSSGESRLRRHRATQAPHDPEPISFWKFRRKMIVVSDTTKRPCSLHASYSSTHFQFDCAFVSDWIHYQSVNAVLRTNAFDKWLRRLSDHQGKARILNAFGHSNVATLAIVLSWVGVFPKYGFTTGRVTGSTTAAPALRFTFCSVAGQKEHNSVTSPRRSRCSRGSRGIEK